MIYGYHLNKYVVLHAIADETIAVLYSQGPL